MLLMCSDCFEVDYRKRKYGIYCKKCGGNLEEIDDNFIQAISLLNKKGYTTKFCCSGHPKNDHINESYIFFEKSIVLPHLPNGYKYEEDIYPQIDHTDWQKMNGIHTCIRTKFDDGNPIILQKSILQNAINVLDWANLLPIIEGRKHNIDEKE